MRSEHRLNNPKQKSRANRRSRKSTTVPGAQNEYNAATAENRAALTFVKSFKGPNNKYINSVFNGLSSATLVATAPYIACLNAVGQGTTENTRIGRLVKHKWLDLDLQCYTPSFAGNANVRIYIVVETSALGSALSPSQFFVDATTFIPVSQRDRTNRNASRYVVLWDSRPFSLGGLPVIGTAGYSASALPSERTISIHLPLNFSTDYSRGNAGTVADIDTNALSIMVCTDIGVAGNLLVTGGFTTCFNDDS